MSRGLILAVLFAFLGSNLYAQKHLPPQVLERIDVPPPVCHFSDEPVDTHVPLPAHLVEQIRNGRIEQQSTFIPIYSDNYPEEAKPALEYALEIWGALLPSDVPIYVSVEFLEQEFGTLASATANGYYRITAGQEEAAYPIALAEKIIGETINADGEPDILVFVGNREDWYYGTDGDASVREFDLASILLHEVAHGLGFAGSAGVNSSLGFMGFGDEANRTPGIYDVFVENRVGTNLFTGFPNASADLAQQLQGDALFFNGPLSVFELAARPKLFAPTVFNQGSSYSHLDEATYAPGNRHSLMSPSISPGEVIHDPGITLQLFADLGWISTRLLHTPLGDTENASDPYPVVVEILSDTTYDAEQVQLHYSFDEGETYEVVTMSGTGNANEFAAEIPTAGSEITINYYISVPESTGRTMTSPGAAPESRTHSFFVGVDTEAPQIIHDPIPFIVTSARRVDVIAAIIDNLSTPLSSVTIEYRLNGEDQEPIEMTLDDEPRLKFVEQTHSGAFTFADGDLAPGDVLEYRIVAVDGSSNANTASSPETGFHVVPVEEVAEVADSYTNDFNDASTASDFIGETFIFDQPSAFSSPALHSPHPYPYGDEVGQTEINMIHQLKIPIRVKSTPSQAKITFDEIVLVEPGEPNVPFGEAEFWDYVIVEGSKDQGETWLPLLDGYDSRDKSNWLSLYNSTIRGNDSEANGNEGLYHTREINILQTFEPGDEILIRFRLFSDPFARGWGWAIDNLFIQALTPLEAPIAREVTEADDQGFTARWFASAEATSYILDVSNTSDFSTFLAGYEAKPIDGFEETLSGLESGETYYFRVRATDGERISPNSNVVSVTLGTATGIEEYVTENNFNLFPNPTTGELSLNVDFVKQAEQLEVQVTDLLGKVILREQFKPQGLNWQQRISLQGKPAGMYLVSLKVDGGVLTKKVFLNR